jgi:uncharacterized membrane protein YedE/YeeE
MIREHSLTNTPDKGGSLAQSTLVQSLTVLLVGMAFGIVLTKSEVISWFRIQSMFRFEEAHVYLVMASAIAVGALSLWILKRFQWKSLQGEVIKIKEKPYQKGVIFGGLLFGMGWAITGACPGPIYAQLGGGEILALITFAGAFVGSYLYAYARPYLPH